MAPTSKPPTGPDYAVDRDEALALAETLLTICADRIGQGGHHLTPLAAAEMAVLVLRDCEDVGPADPNYDAERGRKTALAWAYAAFQEFYERARAAAKLTP